MKKKQQSIKRMWIAFGFGFISMIQIWLFFFLCSQSGVILSNADAAELALYQDGFFYETVTDPRPLVRFVAMDAYGRKMFRYRAPQGSYFYAMLSDFYRPVIEAGENPVVYIIIQKKTLHKVFYYKGESLCFITDGTPDEELETFKAANDWGRPRDLSQATGTSIDAFDYVLDNRVENKKELAASLAEKTGKDSLDGGFYAIYNERFDPIFDEPIYIMRECYVGEDGTLAFKETYVFTANANNEILDYERLKGSLDSWPKQIRAFQLRQENF